MVDSPAAEARLLALWTRLRVSVIGSIWAARCARDKGRLRSVSLARYAVQLAVRILKEGMDRDWLRVSTDIRTLDNGYFCCDWWRGFDPHLSLEKFQATWAHQGVFCEVVPGDDSLVPPRAPALVSRLGLDQPVRFPD
jgi:hypothetical protein